VGYEVIDEQGPLTGAGPPVERPAPPWAGSVGPGGTAEPYDLGELEPVEPAPPRPARRRPSATGVRGRLERLAHVPSVLAGAGLVLGAVLGGYVVNQHAAGEAEAQARSTVNAVAVAENQLANGINGVRMASLTVRLTNFGPLALEPVLSPTGQEASQTHPLVQASTPHPKADADGGSILVTVTLPLPCDQALSTVQLPVRTADRQVHQLDVHSPESEVLEQDRTMCERPETPHSFVTAILVGTPTAPVLRFSNQADQARRIWLQSDMSSLVPVPGVTIRLSPALPHDIDPHATFDLHLTVHANRCVRDVASYEQAQVWLGFLDTDIGHSQPPTESDWQNVMGSSVGSVVTAAMLKACE
jgi:hypothetical protein